MPVNFNNLIDDDGTGTTGTLIDVAELQYLLLDEVPARSATTGTVDNWGPGLAGHSYLEWAGSGDLTVTGLAAGRVGQRVEIRNMNAAGGGIIYLPHQHTGSASANRLWNTAVSAPTPIAPGGFAAYRYSVYGAWVLMTHAQGRPVPVPFNAANFGASGGTWTVEAGDVIAYEYLLSGARLTIVLHLNTTTITGTPAYLTVAIPAGFTARTLYRAEPNLLIGAERGFLQVAPNVNTLSIYKDTSGTIAASANALTVFGSITLDVG